MKSGGGGYDRNENWGNLEGDVLISALFQLLDAIEDEVKQGGYIIDWHACDLFPKSWIDLVVVLRVDSTLLYDRLKARYVTIALSLPFLSFTCLLHWK